MTVTGTSPGAHILRYNRRTRLLHTATYLVTTVLLITGLWLGTGHEGQPSLLADLINAPDTELHRLAGWLLTALAIVPLTVGIRATATFVRETFRVDQGDAQWLLQWPTGALTGRFASHRGHFDPGQRLANIAFVATLGTLVGSGIGLTNVHGGPAFVWLVRAHRHATFALTLLVVGHVLLAVGLLPGYRGAWRSMHLGGRIPATTVRRLWPRTADGSQRDSPAKHPNGLRRSRDRPKPS